MNRAYIGLGSNLGQSENLISSALFYLSRVYTIDVKKRSSLYQSKPLSCRSHALNPQPDYINAVACLTGDFEPLELLDVLQTVECHFGRQRQKERWASRTLDLDILLFNHLQIAEERLIVPHPGLLQRDFVLYPLLEIAPELEIPGFGPISQAIEACENRGLEVIDEHRSEP